jgi:exosortase A-associated hydrolase 1
VDETALTFACGDATLVGVLSQPAAGLPASGIGVVVVVGGPQYRVGAHRQFVQLARRLAAAGHVVLRFDVRGMGDSTGARRGFEALDDDIAAAAHALRRAAPQTRRVVLWGLCDGASAALMYCARAGAPGIDALCLVNPWLRSEQSLARTHLKHHYWQRLKQPAFWRRVLRGEVALAAGRELLASLRRASARSADRPGSADPDGDFRVLMARGWHRFNGALLLVVSDDDLTAREFLEGSRTLPAWQGAMSKPGLTMLRCADADHTFSVASKRTAMEEGVLRWLAQLVATPVPA